MPNDLPDYHVIFDLAADAVVRTMKLTGARTASGLMLVSTHETEVTDLVEALREAREVLDYAREHYGFERNDLIARIDAALKKAGG